MRPQRNRFRDLIDLSGLWTIRFDPLGVGEAEGWTRDIGEGMAIAVPGSWNEQLAEAGYMNYVGDAWLQTDVFVPLSFAGRAVSLYFGSADTAADVWVNGVHAGRSGPAYLPFSCSVERAVTPGATARVIVRVSNLLPTQGPTQRVTQDDYVSERRTKDEYYPAVRYDFFPFGGLNRAVALVAVPKTGLEQVALTPTALGTTGVLSIAATTAGTVAAVRVTACGDTMTLSPDGAVATGVLHMPDCPLWSPEQPNLHMVRIEALAADGAVIDQLDVRTGFRDVRVGEEGLLLNGAPLTLRGFGKHEDSVFRGRGVDLPLMVKDFHLLKWCGANSVRTSHYPYTDEFYDLCDEHGILVIDEVFSINLDFTRVEPAGLAAHKEAVRALIERDRSHPCVIAWSLANEPGYLGEACYAEASRPYWRELFADARAHDPSRPLTHANVQYAGLDDPAFEESDFLMINRYYGWYSAPAQLDRAVALLEADFDALHRTHRKPIFVSEFGADAIAGAHATTPQLFTEDYQADMIAAYWDAIERHPAVFGGHVWNFADFRTAQHSRRAVMNLKGVFTRTREPKKAAYRLRELWRANPKGRAE